jgi:signal transduction histidine kinase
MVAEATGAERAEVWLRSGGSERLEAAWPSAVDEPEPSAGSATVAPDGRTRAFAVVHRGERLGALRVTCSAREPLTPAGERLMRDVAAQAGLVLRNVGLIEDLRASRQRLVAAADEARRGLERNLHDGAQQQLVALRISLGLARQVLAGSPEEAAELLAQTEHQAEEALQELRDLAHGIYPPLLADLGLGAALEAQARKAAVPVTVEASAVGRHSQEIEAAVYFCVLEALQNVAKYAQAPVARATLCQEARVWRSPSPMTAPASTPPPRRWAPGCKASPTAWQHSAAPSTSPQPPVTAPSSQAGYQLPAAPALTNTAAVPALSYRSGLL